MTYLGAAQHAQEAMARAQSARRNSSELYERRMAQATEELAAAVKELAETLHRES